MVAMVVAFAARALAHTAGARAREVLREVWRDTPHDSYDDTGYGAAGIAGGKP